MKRIITLVLLTLSLAIPSAFAAQKAVLVTGASSGLGLDMTQRLAAEGHFVYAGARKDADLERLSAMDNVQGVRLDVTVPEDIAAAVETIKKGGRGLHGLVNNAGVVVVSPLIDLEESDLDFIFDVNVYGPYRVTKAFAPLLSKSEGRVVNISSISGFGLWFGGGAYTMSKHALEAFSDTLVLELAPLNIKVSAVEPGNFKSKIGESYCRRLLASGETPKEGPYKQYHQQQIDDCKDSSESDSADPKPVSDAVAHALFADMPKKNYLVTPNQEEADWAVGELIADLVSLTRDHPHALTLEQITKMIEEEMGYQAAGTRRPDPWDEE